MVKTSLFEIIQKMGRLQIGTPAFQRRLSGMVLSSIGVITGLMHIDHLLENSHTMPVISGVVFPLCLSVVLFYAGYWLATSDYRGEQAVTIVVWSVAGAICLTLVGAAIFTSDILVHHHSLPATSSNTPFIILPSSVTEGTVTGFIYGIYVTWSH
ncbi:hypothetical protein V5735_19970 [Haladaptatus sp. SPP-AMP-3]|uniref:hypothetical protein n=1 Tax=Haladaptatus sp. SPP-AMP-3 TaxID=3121295 RepID=UPI003C2FC2B2